MVVFGEEEWWVVVFEEEEWCVVAFGEEEWWVVVFPEEEWGPEGNNTDQAHRAKAVLGHLARYSPIADRCPLDRSGSTHHDYSVTSGHNVFSKTMM